MLDINHHWYRSNYTWLTFMLLPLSGLYWLAVNGRRLLYWLGVKKKFSFNTPVIVVGNITVGGTGKTPFVIWLANFLKEQGLRPGIVSRGYGGKEFSQSTRVDAASDPRLVGDEAVLLARRAECPVMVGTNRVAAVQALLKETDCNIVISDDGLQHYRLNRQLEIVMVDGERRFGNRRFLPAGPLRESLSRLKKVDFVIAQQGALLHEYEMLLSGNEVVSLTEPKIKKSLSDLMQTPVHVVAAIGNPQRFFTSLQTAGLDIIPNAYPDHYHYAKTDFDFDDDYPVLMTEKDAVKCQSFAQDNWWYLPVNVEIDAKFTKNLLKKINEYLTRIY
jgi:tetraacyldisaccharide 4'-kinase